VVVVVSEETGSISYAYKGQFVRGITSKNCALLTTVLVNPGSLPQLGRLAARLDDRPRKSAPPPTPAHPGRGGHSLW